jgi:DNA-binding response OmpR family regulator
MAIILTVDDDEKIRALLDTILTHRGHQLVTASNGSEAIEVFRCERPLVTILDLQLPDMNGLSVLQAIRALDPAVPVIILTGADTAQLEQDARELGATEILQKGLSLHTIGDTVNRLLTQGGSTGARSQPERRQHPRLPVQLHAALLRDGVAAGDGEIVDLSVAGCALRTLLTVTQGDYLALQITNPLSRSEQEACVPFTCDLAVVRWVRQPTCGLEFIMMTSENKDRLYRYIRALQDHGRATASA